MSGYNLFFFVWCKIFFKKCKLPSGAEFLPKFRLSLRSDVKIEADDDHKNNTNGCGRR